MVDTLAEVQIAIAAAAIQAEPEDTLAEVITLADLLIAADQQAALLHILQALAEDLQDLNILLNK